MYDDYHRIDAYALEHARHKQCEFDAISKMSAKHLVGHCDALTGLLKTGGGLTIHYPLGKQSAKHGIYLSNHRPRIACLIGRERGIACFTIHNHGCLLQNAGDGGVIGRNIRHQRLRQNVYAEPLIVRHKGDVTMLFGHNILLGAIVAVIAHHQIELRHHAFGAVGKFCKIGHQREVGNAHSGTRLYHRKHLGAIASKIFAKTFYLHILKCPIAVIDDFERITHTHSVIHQHIIYLSDIIDSQFDVCHIG